MDSLTSRKKNLKDANRLVGSCSGMIPEAEKTRRRTELRSSIFERDNQNQPDENAMIKEYRRAGADQEEPAPEDLRTPRALKTTMIYLVNKIMDDERSQSPDLAIEWYDFLWDRLRAIRKDITQQNICDKASVKLVERCARFHVHSCYAMNRVKDFDVDMNKRNLNDCLQMLRQMYCDLRQVGITCAGEVEFQKYDILLHLDQDTASTNVLMKTSDHRSSSDMKFVMKIINAYSQNNYHKFFDLMSKADYMTSCILGLYANRMRFIGLKIIIDACAKRQVTWYPINLAIASLGFTDIEDILKFAADVSIDCKEKDSQYYLLLSKDSSVDALPPPIKSWKLIESKMENTRVGQLIYGKFIDPSKEGLLADSSDGELTEEYEHEEWQPVVEECLEEEEEQARDVEMSDAGQGPRFRKKLQGLVVSEEETTEEIELIVSTERDQWTDSSDKMKINWLLNDTELASGGGGGRRQSVTSEYRIENFYTETSSECFHRLIIKRSNISSSKVSRYTCRASNEYGEASTSCQVKRLPKKPRFLRTLEDTETHVGETITMRVAVDITEDSIEDLQFSKDGQLVYSSKRDGETTRELKSSSKSRVRVRTTEETIEVVEEEEERTYMRRRSSASSNQRRRLAKVVELVVENVQVDQMGSWECTAKNEAGASSCKADVEVFAEPRIVTDLPASQRVAPGKEIRLTVEASGSPTPVFSGFKDEIGIAEEENRVYTETKTSSSSTRTTTTTTQRRSSVSSQRNEDGVSITGETLIIRDARPEEAGTYSCKVENRLGQVQPRDCKLTVIGHGDDLNSAPRIIKDFSRDQLFELDEGESVVLKVPADGHPRPRQQLYRNEKEMPAGKFKTFKKLMFRRPPESPSSLAAEEPPKKKRVSNVIRELKEKVDDETQANDKLLKLLKIFI